LQEHTVVAIILYQYYTAVSHLTQDIALIAGACKTGLAQNYEMSSCQAGLFTKVKAMLSQFNLTEHGFFLYLTVDRYPCFWAQRRDEMSNTAL
jgi:hypothetical protein